MNEPGRCGWTVLVTLVGALILAVLPLPEWAAPWRPAWVALALIYWWMAVPGRVGLSVGWFAGLILDVLTGTLLGQHALSLVIIGYLTMRLHLRLRFMPLWQQASVVLLLLMLERLISAWILGVTRGAPDTFLFWMPALTSALIWPWVFLFLRRTRRQAGIY